MLLIGLISDTHVPSVADELPPRALEVFADVDMILHAGDIGSRAVLEQLSRIAPTLAVKGNIDEGNPELADLPTCRTVWAEDLLIGITHQLPTERSRGLTLFEEQVNIVVYGHSHRDDIQTIDSVLFVNPGSPTFRFHRHGLGTVALLRINQSNATAEIVALSTPEFP